MGSELPPAIFIAGSLGLDFLNSLARPIDEEVDWLSNGSDFLSWMKQAKLLATDDIVFIETSMSAKELDQISTHARSLREWLRGFVREHIGKPLTANDLTQLHPLDNILKADEMFWMLTPGEISATDHVGDTKSSAAFQLRIRRRWKKPEALLSPIAEEIAKFVCTADFRYVKGCQGHNCVLFFLDQTRGHGRRWCSMAVCGNRAKQEAHLERIKKRKS